MKRARTSLPVPVSPSSSVGALVGPIRRAMRNSSRVEGLSMTRVDADASSNIGESADFAYSFGLGAWGSMIRFDSSFADVINTEYILKLKDIRLHSHRLARPPSS